MEVWQKIYDFQQQHPQQQVPSQDEGSAWPCSGRWIALEVSSIAFFVSLERTKSLLHSFITANLHPSDCFSGPMDGSAGWKCEVI